MLGSDKFAIKTILNGLWHVTRRLILAPVAGALLGAVVAAIIVPFILLFLALVTGLPYPESLNSDWNALHYLRVTGYAIGAFSGWVYGLFKGWNELVEDYPALNRLWVKIRGKRYSVWMVSFWHDNPDLNGQLEEYKSELNERQELPEVGDFIPIPELIQCATSEPFDGQTDSRMVMVRTSGEGWVSYVHKEPHNERPGYLSVSVGVRTDQVEIVANV